MSRSTIWRKTNILMASLLENDNDQSSNGEFKSIQVHDNVDVFESDSNLSLTTVSSVNSDFNNSFELLHSEVCSDLVRDLSKWAVNHAITHSSLNDLLVLMRNHGHANLPKNAKTLLKTPDQVNTEKLCSGDYIYLGLATGIKKMLQDNEACISNEIHLIVNLDELPLFKSSNIQLWPLLCWFGSKPPFPVAFFLW